MKTLFARITDPAARLPGPSVPQGVAQDVPTAGRPLTRVFVRDLVLPAVVGIYDHEKTAAQRLRVNLDLGVLDRAADGRDAIVDVVSYEDAIATVTAIVGRGHVNLLETLAETIAAALLQDGRVHLATIRLEKLDAFANCAAVGIEITRARG